MELQPHQRLKMLTPSPNVERYDACIIVAFCFCSSRVRHTGVYHDGWRLFVQREA